MLQCMLHCNCVPVTCNMQPNQVLTLGNTCATRSGVWCVYRDCSLGVFRITIFNPSQLWQRKNTSAVKWPQVHECVRMHATGRNLSHCQTQRVVIRTNESDSGEK